MPRGRRIFGERPSDVCLTSSCRLRLPARPDTLSLEVLPMADDKTTAPVSPIPASVDAGVAGCSCSATTWKRAQEATSPCGAGYRYDPTTGQCVPKMQTQTAGRRR
jgi:hypothetical protein